MTDIQDLEQKLKELKLEKRELLLAGKKTTNIDEKIKTIEYNLKESYSIQK